MSSDNPFRYRSLLVVVIDILIVLWMIYLVFFDSGVSDVLGVFLLVVFAVGVVFNVYAWVLIAFFPRTGRIRVHIEAMYVVLLLLPFVALRYFFS